MSSGSFRLRRSRGDDLSSVRVLIDAAGLPIDGVADHFGQFVVAEEDGNVVAAAGLEIYGYQGLLRSVVVSPGARGRGLGAALVLRMLEAAQASQVKDIYLLTTTAAEYFGRHGFARVDRAQAPAAITQSAEFRGACPASAILMHRKI